MIHVQWQPDSKCYHVNIASQETKFDNPEDEYFFRSMKCKTEKELIDGFPDLDITREQLFLAQLAAKGTVFKRIKE